MIPLRSHQGGAQVALRAYAVLIALVLAACSSTQSPTPTAPSAAPLSTMPGSTPTASLTGTASPTPSRSTRIATRGVDWERVDLWFENSDGRTPSPVGVIFTGAGFVAWGPTQFGSGLLASRSGSNEWAPIGNRGQFDGVRIVAMAAAPFGTVALGIDPKGATRAWRSSDGVTWTAGPRTTGIDGVVRTLVSAGGTYYAGGTAKDGCDVAIWSSSDGFAWQPSEPLTGATGTCPIGGGAEGPAISLIRNGFGLVALRSMPDTGSAIWISTDEVRWTFHSLRSLGGSIASVTAGGPGYVAVGATANQDAASWTSPDGATWDRGPDQPSLHGATMVDVRALDDGTLLAVGTDRDNQFVAWTSADGLAWVRQPQALYPSGAPGPGERVTMMATDGHATSLPSERLIAVGGGSQAWVSPPITPGLRAATITMGLSGRVDRSASTVQATCSDDESGSGRTRVMAVFPNTQTGPNPYQVSLVVTPTVEVTSFGINSDGLSVNVGQGAPIDPSTFTVEAGSTADDGSITFRGLVDELGSAGARTLSGSLRWACS